VRKGGNSSENAAKIKYRRGEECELRELAGNRAPGQSGCVFFSSGRSAREER